MESFSDYFSDISFSNISFSNYLPDYFSNYLPDYVIPVGLAVGSGIGLYYVYKYAKGRINKYIVERVLDEMNKNQTKDGILFKPLGRTKSAVILYKDGGKEHKVCVPYDRTKSRKMLRKKVFLVRSSDSPDEKEERKEERIEITHKPGVPYLLTPREMGGIRIEVIKDGTVIQEYNETEVPYYLD